MSPKNFLAILIALLLLSSTTDAARLVLKKDFAAANNLDTNRPIPQGVNSRLFLERLLIAFKDVRGFGVQLAKYLDLDDELHCNFCDIMGFECSAKGELESITLTAPVGKVNFDRLPSEISVLKLKNGTLSQALDLSKLPYTVHTLEINGTKFLEDSAVTFPRRIGLQSFSCINCGITKITNLSPMLHLDLSHNPQLDLPADVKLPPTLLSLKISHCDVSRSLVELQPLPPALTKMNMAHNRLEGALSAVAFPQFLQELYLNNNRLSGSAKFNEENIPAGLKRLDISYNKLEGALSGINSLTSLEKFSAAHNKIKSMTWVYGALPSSLQTFDISHNAIAEKFVMHILPETIKHVAIGHNQFSGTANLESLPPLLEYLDLSSNQLTGTPNITALPESIRFIFLDHNRFSGVPDLSRLPSNLRKITVRPGNKWTPNMPRGMLDEEL